MISCDRKHLAVSSILGRYLLGVGVLYTPYLFDRILWSSIWDFFGWSWVYLGLFVHFYSYKWTQKLCLIFDALFHPNSHVNRTTILSIRSLRCQDFSNSLYLTRSYDWTNQSENCKKGHPMVESRLSYHWLFSITLLLTNYQLIFKFLYFEFYTLQNW